ncbi:MAG: NAD-dependent epimerase/dehydratase family protein [Terriglobales bacterium]
MNSVPFNIQNMSMKEPMIVGQSDPILITGANGFIGSSVVEALLRAGFTNLRCFVRPSSNLSRLEAVLERQEKHHAIIIGGNLLAAGDCERAAKDAKVIYHLAAGIEKTFPGSFMNSVVTTRNLLNAAVQSGGLRRFVNVSSFAVYSNWNMGAGSMLDEGCELESRVVERAEAYAFAKLKQDEQVRQYAEKHGFEHVILRPGAVYGPGAHQLTSRVGIDTFGIFLHLGGSNQIPLTYVDNCAQAIVLAGLTPGVDREVFNIVDDDLPSSRKFLRMYKRNAKPFRSLYVPYWAFYGFCALWEKYSKWSKGQLPPVFNRRRCATYWKGNRYSNRKLKERLGWQPSVSFAEGATRYFQHVRSKG